MKLSHSLATLVLISVISLAGCAGEHSATQKSTRVKPTTSHAKSSKQASEETTALEVTISEAMSQAQELLTDTARAEASTYQAIPMPGEAVGTWSGISAQADSVEFTITADGTIHTLSEYNRGTDNVRVEETTATITSLFEVAPHVYFIDRYNGSYEALLPGITGLGGLGGNVYFGFTLENGIYVPITWTVGDGDILDYTKWTSFGNTAAYTQGELSEEDRIARDESLAHSNM